MASKADEDLLDYEEEAATGAKAVGGAGAGSAEPAKDSKGHFVGVHSSSFRDFMLKPELQRAIVDFGFEHPSAVQHEAIPQALLGMDVLCQAKSGMGKTAVFVLSTLNQIDAAAAEGRVAVLVLCHTRELAHQIAQEFKRFSKYMPTIKTSVLYGGKSKAENVRELEADKPSIIVGTPGRVLDLIEDGSLKVDGIGHFILDECDKLIDSVDMRATVQKIFLRTPREKQVLMFSATLSPEVKPVCLKFMDSPLEIYVESDSKLTLHGLLQYYVKLEARAKNRKLTDLLDSLEFNQVVIFVSTGVRARELDRLLKEANFPTEHVHGGMPQEERIKRYDAFRKNETRILIATNLFGRGIDVEHVNVVINYDFPSAADKSGEAPADQYLHRVGRAGRFGTKGLAISFIASPEDEAALGEVQKRFAVEIPELPDRIDAKAYIS